MKIQGSTEALEQAVRLLETTGAPVPEHAFAKAIALALIVIADELIVIAEELAVIHEERPR